MADREMTRLKLIFIWIVIAVGIVIIAVWQWNVATHKGNFGNESFEQGALGKALLGAVMIGIPAILFAVLAYLALEWLLFRPGELQDYRARRRIAALRHSLGERAPAPPQPDVPKNDYVD